VFGSSVSVVPLRAGGGTRLKIYEAMAAKVPVVSTTVGAEGLEFADGETIAIADRPRNSRIAAFTCCGFRCAFADGWRSLGNGRGAFFVGSSRTPVCNAARKWPRAVV